MLGCPAGLVQSCASVLKHRLIQTLHDADVAYNSLDVLSKIALIVLVEAKKELLRKFFLEHARTATLKHTEANVADAYKQLLFQQAQICGVSEVHDS